MRINPDLARENRDLSDASDRWRKIWVEQADDLHHDDGSLGLSLVVDVVHHHCCLLVLCCWVSCCCGVNVRLLAKLEASWRPFVSLHDQWAVA